MCGAKPSNLLGHLGSDRWGVLVVREHESPLVGSERREDGGEVGGVGLGEVGGGGHGDLRRVG